MANRYLTLGHNLTPYITTYKVTNDATPTFTKIADPATLPPGDVYDVRWNNSATSLAITTFIASPYVSIYNVTDDVLTQVKTFTDLTSCLAIAWNHDGSKIALGDSASPYIKIYNRSGDTFTQISDPSSLPTGTVNDISWSLDGQQLAIAHTNSPYLTVYTVSGDTFTKVADPALSVGFDGLSVAWNFTGNALAVGGSSTGLNGKVYNFIGNTLSHAANIGPIGINASLERNTIAWRPINEQLATKGIVYDRTGNTYANASANITTTAITSVSWDNTGNILSIGTNTSTFIRNFSQVSSNGFAQLSNLTSAPTSTVRSISWGYGGVTQSANAAITSEVSLSSTARISTQSGRAALTTISTLSARILGDILYVVDGYVDTDYFIVGSDFEYFEPDYIEDDYVAQPFVTAAVSSTITASLTADAIKLKQQSSNISTELSLVSAGDRIRYADTSMASIFASSSIGKRTRSAAVSLSAFNTTLTVGDLTRSATAVLASAFTQSALANYTLSPNISLTATSTVSASLSVLKSADVSLSAFNTVLSAVGRIRGLGSDMAVSTTLSATPIKIRTAATNNNLKTINPTPYTGIYIDRTDHYALLDDEEYLINNPTRIVGGATDSAWVNDAIISFWARCDDYTGGTIFSSEGTDLNLENAFTLKLSPTLISLSSSYSAGITGNSFFSANLSDLGILPGEWHHYFILVDHGGPSGAYDVIIAVDGVDILTDTGTDGPRDFLRAVNPIAIGIKRNRVPEPGNLVIDQLLLSERFKGTIAQLWIGDSVGGDVLSEFYDASNPITPFIDFGTTGRTSGNTIQQPVWYEQFNYPFTNDVIGVAMTDSSLQIGYSNYYGTVYDELAEPIDSDYLPSVGNQPIVGRFTLFGNGDRTVFADMSANSAMTLTSTASYNKPGAANLVVVSAFTANSYDFTKGSVALSSTASIAIIDTRIKYATAIISSALSATLVASDRNTGSATLASEFTISADPTTNVLGIVSAQLTASLSALAYDFTKAQATISANFTLLAEGRYEERIRANADIISTATLTSSLSRTRPGQTNLNVLGSLLLADGGALRRGNIAMSAFNTVLTAGKLIEFYLENTIKVAQELRVLHVYDDVESNVLLVEDAQELNKIYVEDGLETTKIYPEQETGVLLAQHRQPTF